MASIQPAYMRIRQYAVSLCRAAGDTPVKIHTEHELCKLFDVSRFTVRKALKSLVDEGYLSQKAGMGTFVNPAKGSNYNKSSEKIPCFGVIAYSGRRCIRSITRWKF